MAEEMSKRAFRFGRNWERFVSRYLTDERVRVVRDGIVSFLGLPDLAGKYFIDVGCGSGIASLAAFDAGAGRIVSFDSDADSVRATERARAMRGNPPGWTVLSGSILDDSFTSGLSPADIVYAWGVLHHTGDMWKAIERASRLVRPGGLIYMALYTKTPRSDHWLRIKRNYNAASEPRKRMMEMNYFLRYTFIPELIHGRNPIKAVREHKGMRGMSYLIDLRDWLGGWPYEDAGIEDVLRFCRSELNLELINIATGQANTEYLFMKRNPE